MRVTSHHLLGHPPAQLLQGEDRRRGSGVVASFLKASEQRRSISAGSKWGRSAKGPEVVRIVFTSSMAFRFCVAPTSQEDPCRSPSGRSLCETNSEGGVRLCRTNATGSLLTRPHTLRNWSFLSPRWSSSLPTVPFGRKERSSTPSVIGLNARRAVLALSDCRVIGMTFARLARQEIGTAAIKDRELLAHVVRLKGIFYRSGFANYQACLEGKFRLVPDEPLRIALERDFSAMVSEGMFFEEPSSFATILEELRTLEASLNRP